MTQIGPVMIQGVFFLLSLAAILFLFSRFFAGDVMRVLISSDAILNATEEFWIGVCLASSSLS